MGLRDHWRACVALVFSIVVLIISVIGIARLLIEHQRLTDVIAGYRTKYYHVIDYVNIERKRSKSKRELLPIRCFLAAVSVNICIRISGIWKLWQSLIQCDKKPKEALKSVGAALELAVGTFIVWGMTFYLIPVACIEFVFIYYCINGFRKQLVKTSLMPATNVVSPAPPTSPIIVSKGDKEL